MMEKRLGIIFLLIIVPIVLGVKDKSSEKNVEEAHVHTEEGGDTHPTLPSSEEDTSDRQRDSQELKGNKLTNNDESSSDQQQIPTNQQQLPPDQQQVPPDQQQVPLDQQQVPLDQQHLPKDDSNEYPHETKENKDKPLSNTPSEPEDAKFIEGEELIGRLNLYEKAKGYKLLQEAAAVGNTKAQEHLAYGYLYGNVLQRNFTRAFEIFEKLAKKGVPSGQMGLGLMYSMGIGVNSSQAKAILYYTFGALGYNPYARMAMGYRSFFGVGAPQSCESALSYYSKVAETVIDKASIFAGSHAVQKVRLTQEDDESNVFGGVTEDEVDHYREVFADSGAQLSLGLYYLLGLGGVERNLPQALELLRRADSPTAYALIGRIYAEGSPPEIQQNNKTAIQYFKRAIEHKTPEGYTGLGIMYFKGMGVEQDYHHAMEYFQKAADKGSPEAHLYIGLGHLYGLGKPVNPNKALSSLKLSAQGGHVLALYHLANIYAKGLAGRRNCNQAVELYKSVAERGKWSRLLREAHRLYLSGDSDSALMIYLHLGEMGIEVAQCNAAYILEEGDTVMINQSEVLKRALMLWSRSATQGYSVARVKLGDYYYYGHGTEKDLELAADQYRMASDRMASAQAMFNLGYMYEQGIGLQQDFHLAKRYYDMAAETSADAAVPVSLALLKLNSLFYFQAIHTYLRNNDQVQSLSNAIHSVLGDQWDIYLIAVLCVVLAIVVRWYRR